MGNAFTDDLLDLMPSTVLVAPFLGNDGYGVPSYGPDVAIRARVNNQQRLVRVSLDETVIARGVCYLATEAPIGTKDRITLPDGSTPLILVSNLEEDETGPTYTKLYFG